MKNAKNRKSSKRLTKIEQLFEIANRAEYFLSDEKVPFVEITCNGKTTIDEVDSQYFRNWLQTELWKRHREYCSDTDLRTAINQISAETQISPKNTFKVSQRSAKHSGSVYIDLCNDDYDYVEVTSSGWKIVKSVPVKLRRSDGMRPLPMPERGGDPNLISKYFNLSDDRDVALVCAFCVFALQPDGPYPLLVFNGPKGSSKSTMSRITQELIDPNDNPLLTFPKNEHDLAIMIASRRLAAFDNISKISHAWSDAFAKYATGASFLTRKLHSDKGLIKFKIRNPIILNGIPKFVEQSDLADRCIFLDAKPIPSSRRKTEVDLWTEFEADKGKIFGIILDGLSRSLSDQQDNSEKALGRMADFAVSGMKSETAFGEKGSFLNTYRRNQQRATIRELERFPFTKAIITFMNYLPTEIGNGDCWTSRTSWTGSASELLHALKSYIEDEDIYGRASTERIMGKEIRKCDAILLENGIIIKRCRSNSRERSRFYKMEKIQHDDYG